MVQTLLYLKPCCPWGTACETSTGLSSGRDPEKQPRKLFFVSSRARAARAAHLPQQPTVLSCLVSYLPPTFESSVPTLPAHVMAMFPKVVRVAYVAPSDPSGHMRRYWSGDRRGLRRFVVTYCEYKIARAYLAWLRRWCRGRVCISPVGWGGGSGGGSSGRQ